MTLGDHRTQTQRRSTRRTSIYVMGTSLLTMLLVGIGFGAMLCCVKADEPAVSTTRNELQRQGAQREPSSTTNARNTVQAMTTQNQQSSLLTERQVVLEPVTSMHMEHDDNLLGLPSPPLQAVSESSRALDMVGDDDDLLFWGDDAEDDDFHVDDDSIETDDFDFDFDDDLIEADDFEYHNVDDWEGPSSSKTQLRAKRKKSRAKKSSSNEYNMNLHATFYGLAFVVMSAAVLSKGFFRSHPNRTTLRGGGQLGNIGMTSLAKSQTARV